MKSSRLTFSVVLAILFGAAFAVTVLVGGFLRFAFRSAPAFGVAQTAGQIVGAAALAGLILVSLIVAVNSALQPAPNLLAKIPNALPAWFAGFTLVGAILMALNIGTVGNFINVWIGAGAVLMALCVAIASWRAPLGPRAKRATSIGLLVTGGLGVVAGLATAVAGVIAQTTTPSFGGPGGGVGPGGEARPGGQGGLPGGDGRPGGQPQGAAPGGQTVPSGPGGGPGPGGPGGFAGPQSMAAPFLIAAVLMLIFAAVLLFVSFRQFRAAGVVGAAAPVALNYGRETGRALGASALLGVVALVAAQLVPVSRTNPPVRTAIAWDSAQTRDLAYRACMDCHSNETVYPWYASVAPGSWLLASHVATARGDLNLSELDALPAFRRANLGQDMGMRIRNGTMPPADYTLMHPSAVLSEAEKQQLIAGLRLSLGGAVTGTLPTR
ncbi:MAG: heme-binding domain-containing protein [Thermoflexales bacterium]|nr:heme-binding domain-containing protein [Thermoflexales bacterium]